MIRNLRIMFDVTDVVDDVHGVVDDTARPPRPCCESRRSCYADGRPPCSDRAASHVPPLSAELTQPYRAGLRLRAQRKAQRSLARPGLRVRGQMRARPRAQVTTANKKISRAGEVAWKQTKRLRQPSKLLAVFGGRRRGAPGLDGEWLSDEGEEAGANRRALLAYGCVHPAGLTG